MTTTEPKRRKRGRPAKVVQPIPDSFENILKAVVQPVRPAKPITKN